jgi:hypothetical protein
MPELNEFESKVKEWLDTPVADRNLEVGATLMLQANRNRILHQNVLRKGNFEKIEYELKKYMEANCTGVGVTSPKINITEEEIKVFAIQQKPVRSGKREDHDLLPLEIQALVQTNSEIYSKMRSIHERLKILSGENYSPKQRLPHITQLMELDKQLVCNWNLYDQWKAGDIIPGQKQETTTPGVPLKIQRVNSNRTYLSRAAKEIVQKRKAGKNAQADKQLEEAQVRYDELIADGQQIDLEIVKKLADAGVETK